MIQRYVQDIDAYCVSADHTLAQVIACIDGNAAGIALMVEADRRLRATLSDGDIRRALLAGKCLTTLAADLIAPDRRPVTAALGTGEAELLHLMNQHGIQQIPLIDDQGRLCDLALMKRLTKEYELPIQAVVMAGGFGTRLRPLTETVPKPMLPVGGKPLLERTIDQLRASGIRQINLTTHYLPERISEHFGNGDRFGVDITYVQEDQPLGTAGALGLIGGSDVPLLVINGDILTNVDFGAMLDFHRAHHAALSVAVASYEMQVPYGVMECDGPMVRAVTEKPRYSFFINAGIYLVESRVLAMIPSGQTYNMTDLIELLVSKGENVISFPIREYWLDIGKHDDYLRAQDDITKGRLGS